MNDIEAATENKPARESMPIDMNIQKADISIISPEIFSPVMSDVEESINDVLS